MLLYFILFTLGLIAAIIGSLIGLGGGVIIVPALLLFQEHFGALSHITPQIAVGTSIVIIIFTATSSTLTYAKKRKVDVGSGLFFFLASGPGAMLGAYINQFFSEALFFKKLHSYSIYSLFRFSFLLSTFTKHMNTPSHLHNIKNDRGLVIDYGHFN